MSFMLYLLLNLVSLYFAVGQSQTVAASFVSIILFFHFYVYLILHLVFITVSFIFVVFVMKDLYSTVLDRTVEVLLTKQFTVRKYIKIKEVMSWHYKNLLLIVGLTFCAAS